MRTAWMKANEPNEVDIRDEILRQLMELPPGSSICPSDVARSLFEMWREQMNVVREVAAEMAIQGQIRVTQRGETVDIEQAKGPVRLQLNRSDSPVDTQPY